MISALLECDSLGRVHLKQLLEYKSGQHIRPPTISITDNIISVQAIVDEYERQISLLQREIEHYRNTANIEATTTTVEVNRLTWWQKLWVGIGKAALIILIIISIVKFYGKK